jgi:type II secretory pathway component PulC
MERAGVVTRAELETHLRDGAQSFIQKVRVRPAFRSGRFLGWRVLAYEGPGPIRIGDVVMRVNGEELERPDQFMKAWNGLRGRSDLVVEMIRAGKRVALRFPIVD